MTFADSTGVSVEVAMAHLVVPLRELRLTTCCGDKERAVPGILSGTSDKILSYVEKTLPPADDV
jgi:hypothetical protein